MENDRDLLLVSIFTMFTVCLWIFFELVKTTQTTTVTKPIEQILMPIPPNIDTDTLNALNSRKRYP